MQTRQLETVFLTLFLILIGHEMTQLLHRIQDLIEAGSLGSPLRWRIVITAIRFQAEEQVTSLGKVQRQ